MMYDVVDVALGLQGCAGEPCALDWRGWEAQVTTHSRVGIQSHRLIGMQSGLGTIFIFDLEQLVMSSLL
jgi:hypothetical protein